MLTDRRDADHRVQTVNPNLQRGQVKRRLADVKRDCSATVRPRRCSAYARLATSTAGKKAAVWRPRKIATSSRSTCSEEDQGRRKVAVLETRADMMDLDTDRTSRRGRILADVGNVALFADRNRFASWTGTAPLDDSTGHRSATACGGPGTGG